ncbi:MAG: hypothetical protein CL472_07280 [Acidobacteria bacterium]|nr:hypothetical protein [Acidobacteriota bacterium]
MTDHKVPANTGLKGQILSSLERTIPDIHILVSDGYYSAAAAKLAENIEFVYIGSKADDHDNAAMPALTYLASCKTTEEIEDSSITNGNAEKIAAQKEADRVDRDQAILSARAAIASETSPLNPREQKLLEALQLAASMVDTPIARRRLDLAGDDERLRELRAALWIASSAAEAHSASEANSDSNSEAATPIDPEAIEIFDRLNPESVNLSYFPRDDFGESGAAGDDLLAECIVYGYQGSGETSWNNSGSHLGEAQVAWAIRLGRALEKNDARKTRQGQAFDIAGDMIAERGFFPSAGVVPYPVARELIAAAIDPENAPPAGEVKTLLENISNYRNDKDSTLASFGARAQQILAKKQPS